jgi:hypothetical protein
VVGKPIRKVSHNKARRDSVLDEFPITEHLPIFHGPACLDSTERVVTKSSPLFVGQSVEICLGTVGGENPPIHAVWRC